MVSRGRHPKSAVASVLSKAKSYGLVVDEDHNGHRWGYLRCPRCGLNAIIWSTPRSADSHAKRLNEFLSNHRHLYIATGEEQ